MNETIIKIQDDGMISVEEVRNGVHNFKHIEPDGLLDCINHSINRGTVNSGVLPRNCLSYTVNDNGERYVTLLHTENRADISYYGTTYQNFPLPRLVFGFVIGKEGRIQGCRMGVVADEAIPKSSTPMYQYPFSNVDGFELCTGNNSMPKCASLHTLASLPYFILQMPNSDDRFHQRNNKPGMGMRALLEHLKDKEPAYYYTEVLKPSEKVLGDFTKL